MKVLIDRFEGDYAVVELEEGDVLIIGSSILTRKRQIEGSIAWKKQ